MKAKAQEARAKVIEAEAEVPKAMAEAFRVGNLGIMDYYKMKNIEADTSMREAISQDLPTETENPLRTNHPLLYKDCLRNPKGFISSLFYIPIL